MRKCYKCKNTKEFTEFHKDKTQVGGFSYECKQCKSQIRKKKRAENPEKYREACRRSTEKNYETIRASQRKHREKNRDRILERRKELREPRKAEINLRESERRKNQRKNDPLFLEIERKKRREYYEKNKLIMIPKHNAHKMVMYAIKLGMMEKKTECEKCGSERKVEGHHEDYNKPLEVIWLCKCCHIARHKEIESLNAER